MRGGDIHQDQLYSYVLPEQRVPADHPLRPLSQMLDTVLKRLSPLFSTLYAEGGRPSIAPEKLLRALLLQCLYSVRSERLLMEELDYNLLFRCSGRAGYSRAPPSASARCAPSRGTATAGLAT